MGENSAPGGGNGIHQPSSGYMRTPYPCKPGGLRQHGGGTGFFEKNWEELLKFSRRTQRQLDRWAARYGYKEQPRDILEHAKKCCHAGRYTCVNLQNSSTIEFRIFRGTLKYNTFLAALQMVNRICDVAIFLSDEELKAMSWSAFAAGCQAPELIRYLKERRLYVNDVISAEEEI